MAATVEDAPRIDDHTGRVHLAGNYTLGFDLDSAFGENNAIKAAGNYHAVPLNLALDLRSFSQDHGLLRNDIALDVAVDAERTGDGQSSFKRHTLIDKSSPLFAGAAFRCTGPLPRHFVPQDRLLPLYRPTAVSQRRVRSELSNQATGTKTAVAVRKLFHQAIIKAHELGVFVVFQHQLPWAHFRFFPQQDFGAEMPLQFVESRTDVGILLPGR